MLRVLKISLRGLLCYRPCTAIVCLMHGCVGLLEYILDWRRVGSFQNISHGEFWLRTFVQVIGASAVLCCENVGNGADSGDGGQSGDRDECKTGSRASGN